MWIVYLDHDGVPCVWRATCLSIIPVSPVLAVTQAAPSAAGAALLSSLPCVRWAAEWAADLTGGGGGAVQIGVCGAKPCCSCNCNCFAGLGGWTERGLGMEEVHWMV